MTTTAEDLELFHFGVKGMKWGVRRKDANGDGRVEGGSSKPSRIEKKIAKSDRKGDLKAARRVARDQIVDNAKSRTDSRRITRTTGLLVTGGLLWGPTGAYQTAGIVAGTEISRSAGYSKGASVAIGLLGGPIGGLAAAEISARKRAKSAVDGD